MQCGVSGNTLHAAQEIVLQGSTQPAEGRELVSKLESTRDAVTTRLASIQAADAGRRKVLKHCKAAVVQVCADRQETTTPSWLLGW